MTKCNVQSAELSGGWPDSWAAFSLLRRQEATKVNLRNAVN